MWHHPRCVDLTDEAAATLGESRVTPASRTMRILRILRRIVSDARRRARALSDRLPSLFLFSVARAAFEEELAKEERCVKEKEEKTAVRLVASQRRARHSRAVVLSAVRVQGPGLRLPGARARGRPPNRLQQLREAQRAAGFLSSAFESGCIDWCLWPERYYGLERVFPGTVGRDTCSSALELSGRPNIGCWKRDPE